MGLKLFSRKNRGGPPAGAGGVAGQFQPAAKAQLVGDALQQALQCRRYGLIAGQRHEWGGHPHFKAVFAKAMDEIDERFGLVPEGFVSIPRTLNDQPGCEEDDHDTEAFLIARSNVSNAEYQLFVDAGSYQNLEFWPEDTWPQLIDFMDMTGEHGPRMWRNGRHDERLADHPVVGVSYYEADAYARWAGYRLTTEAEWQMAASWRLRSVTQTGRRYPWGDALDLACCNIWASGHATTLPVDACPAGAAPNGVLQLIGNVWEWVQTEFTSTDEQGRDIVGEMLLRGIRGGAYDTYFPWQATSAFRTAMVCLTRTHNVGFRCAMDLPGEDGDGDD